MLENILVVDDDEIVLESMRRVITSAGYGFTGYLDPIKALDEYKHDYYSLVLTDFRMGIVDGIEFIEKLTEKDKSIPIVVISSSEPPVDQVLSAFIAGAISFIFKPVDKDILIAKINSIIRVINSIK
jgi:FixJ family two-component response regulator